MMIDCEEDDYIRDLTLAAELGKTLLERNQELQCHIYTLQQIITEKNQEIKLLEKHLNDQKEALSNKLRHLEQIDYQNCELEKQISIYKNTLDKEKFKIKDLNDAYNQLSIQYDELENEYKQYKHQQTHQFNTPSISFQTQTSLPYTPSTPDSGGDSDNECNSMINSGTNNTKKLLKRCSSETNICLYIKEKRKQLNDIENYQNLEIMYKKWSQIFDSYSRKRLVKYKDESIKYKDENIKLNETIIQLKHDLDLVKTRYSTLNIDYEECQNINSSLETKLGYYERLFSTTQQQQQQQQRTIQSSTSSTSSLTSSLSSNNLWKHVDMIECDIDRHINNNNSANSNCKDDICNNNNNNCSDFVNNNNNLNDSLSTCLNNKLIKRLNDGSSIYASNDSINLLNDLISIKQQHIQLTKQYDNMSLKNEFDIYLQEHKDIYHQNNNNTNLNASTSSCNSTTSSSSNVCHMKVDAQTQTKSLNNNNNLQEEEETVIKQVSSQQQQTFVSSNRCPEVYKEIFSRIYETINSSKTII